jgi:hypothetical protein
LLTILKFRSRHIICATKTMNVRVEFKLCFEPPSPSLSPLFFLIPLLTYESHEEGRSSPSFLVLLLRSHASPDICGVTKLSRGVTVIYLSEITLKNI